MKKLEVFHVLFIWIFLCSFFPDGYITYQTFDEYKLMGVPAEKTLEEPYVWVKSTTDTIYVMISDKPDEQLVYINNGNYWYNLTSFKAIPYEDCKCDTTTKYFEKFIYNDTIIECDRIINDSLQEYVGFMSFETKNSKATISFEKEYVNKDAKFERLRNIASSFKKKYPRYKPEYQKYYYNYYIKVLRGNILFVYLEKENPKYKYGCLGQVIDLRSLGEFQKESHGVYDLIWQYIDTEKECE